jgi:hypothetical protein
VHREENHPDVRIVVLELRERVDAVEMRHGDVGDDDVRPQPLCGLHECSAVFDDPNELELFLEQTLQPLRNQAMVIGKQDSRALHGVPVLEARDSGTHADTVVPSPDLLLMLNRPPSTLIRSPMLACPRLGRAPAAAISKPCPLSLTVSVRPPSSCARVTAATEACA